MAFIGLINLLLLLSSISVARMGVHGGRTTVEEEDLELDKSKSFKSFKNQANDTYDCVDILRQPAFDHPLLKNHTIQMSPTTPPINRHSSVNPTDVHCPKGTVPIRRTRKEDLIRAKAFEMSFSSNVIHPQAEGHPGKHYAIMRSQPSGESFLGIGGKISKQSLSLATNQSSSAQMWLEKTLYNRLTSLQSGWIISPDLYGDSIPRFFIFWRADWDQPGCFNLQCPGFIQVNPDIPVDGLAGPLSIAGKQNHHIRISIRQDPLTKNYWLLRKRVHIGYWPKEIIPDLEMGATYGALGGLVTFDPTGKDGGISPPMGYGRRVDTGPGQDNDRFYSLRHNSYFAQLKVLYSGKHMWTAANFEPWVTGSKGCYDLWNIGNGVGDYEQDLRSIFLYGGPGGICEE